MWFVILAFVGLIVVEWGADYSGTSSGTGSDVVGSINGEQVSYRLFQQALQNAVRLRREEGGETDQLVREVWQALVSEVLIRQEVERLGIEITDEELAFYARNAPPEVVRQLPAFQRDGEFDLELYQQIFSDEISVREQRAFIAQVERMIHQQLIAQRLQGLLAETVRVTPQEVRQRYVDRSEKATVEYAFVPVSTVPAEEVTRHRRGHPGWLRGARARLPAPRADPGHLLAAPPPAERLGLGRGGRGGRPSAPGDRRRGSRLRRHGLGPVG